MRINLSDKGTNPISNFSILLSRFARIAEYIRGFEYPSKTQRAIVISGVIIYILLFSPFYALMDTEVVILSTLPVVLTGWYFGMLFGVLSAFLTFPLNVLMLNIVGEKGWEIMSQGAGLTGTLFMVLIGIVVGRLQDRGETLKSDLSERKRVQDKLIEANLELQHAILRANQLAEAGEAFYDTAAAMSSTLEINEVLDRILSSVERVVPHDAADIMLLNEQEGFTHVVRSKGYAERHLESWLYNWRLTFTETPTLNEMSESGRPIAIPDTRESPDWIEIPQTSWIRSYAGAPIRSRDKLIGFMNLASKSPGFFTSAQAERLQIFADQAAIAIENARLFEDAERQLQELTILHDIAISASEATTEDEIIEKVVQIIGQTLYPDNFGILLLDEETNSLRPHPTYQGIGDEERKLVLPLGESVASKVAETGKSWRIPDVSKISIYMDTNPGMQSELCVPLKIGERVIGVVNAESRHLDKFTEDDERLMITFAGQLATAIERLRSEAAKHRYTRQLEILNNLARDMTGLLEKDDLLNTVADRLSSRFGYYNLGIFIVDTSKNQVVLEAVAGAYQGIVQPFVYRQSYGEGIVGKAVESGETIVVNDTRQPSLFYELEGNKILSALAIPLRVDEKVIGVINFDSLHLNAFDPSEVAVLTTLADQLAIAYEKTQLFEETKESLEREQNLNEVTYAISKALDLRSVFEDVVMLTCETIGAEAGSLALVSPDGESLNYLYGYNSIDEEKLLTAKGKGLAWKVIESRGSMIVDDYMLYPEATSRLIDAGVHAFISVPVMAGEECIGVLEIYDYNQEKLFNKRDLALVESIGRQAGIAIQNARLFEELEDTYLQTVLALANAVDARDSYTSDHSQRLAVLAVKISKLMGSGPIELEELRLGALLHDIGKIGVSDQTLLKTGPLNEEEFEEIRQHPIIGARIVEPVKKLLEISPIIRGHHERYDGKGYPDGLKGEDIPLGARILNVVDSYIAMTDDRIYRKALNHDDVLAELKSLSGKQFDPKVVNVFIDILKDGHG